MEIGIYRSNGASRSQLERVQLTKESAIAGFSLAAKSDYEPGDPILSVGGLQTTRNYRTIQTGIATHVQNDLLSYLNHSCCPNTIVNTEAMAIEASARIRAGDELTFFYPSTEWELARPFICRCRAPQCIHLVAGAKYVPIDTLGRYFINSHIRELALAALVKVAA